VARSLQIVALLLLVLSEASVANASDRAAAAAGASTTTGGWRASLFVTSPPTRDESLGIRGTTTVGARLSRSIAPGVRLSLDVFNVFDQGTRELDPFAAARSQPGSGVAENYLFHPAEPRGARIGLTIRF
jgi:hypothetical protein